VSIFFSILGHGCWLFFFFFFLGVMTHFCFGLGYARWLWVEVQRNVILFFLHHMGGGAPPHVKNKKTRASFLLSNFIKPFFMNSLLFFHVILFFFITLFFLHCVVLWRERERESCVVLWRERERERVVCLV
jgi:hypothetical protein